MAVSNISKYEKLIGKNEIDDLVSLASRLKGKKIQSIYSSASPKAVVESVTKLTPLFAELGLDIRSFMLDTEPEFTEISAQFNSALNGYPIRITTEMFQTFIRKGDEILSRINIYGDIIFVHDVQPIAFVKNKHHGDAKWVWRCHSNVSEPDKEVWFFLKHFMDEYDATVFSTPAFTRFLTIPQFIVLPSIDPFSEKNIVLPGDTVARVMNKYGIDIKRPVVTQISDISKYKDPLGVIEAYKLVKRHSDCQLVLAGPVLHEANDPDQLIHKIKELAAKDGDIHLIMTDDDGEINAIRQASGVIVQKSVKDTFCVPMLDAMWKEKPVVASYVASRPLRISHEENGLVFRTVEGCAMHISRLLNNPALAQRLGENGKKHVICNYISSRHLRDYMLLFLNLFQPGDVVSLYKDRI